MKYCVLLLSGKQYRVSEGDEILVSKLKGKADPKILLLKDDDKLELGKPYLEKAKVDLKVGEMVKGEKIEVFKFKAKARYRKHLGFRPQFSPVTIEKISFS